MQKIDFTQQFDRWIIEQKVIQIRTRKPHEELIKRVIVKRLVKIVSGRTRLYITTDFFEL